MPPNVRELQRRLTELADLDERRLELMAELKAADLLRSKGLVGEWGEQVACALLGGKLAEPSTEAYDLTDARGRMVQVKTLRSTPGNSRTSLGMVKPGYHVLLCVRLDARYVPTAAFEIPLALMARYDGKRASLTKALERHVDVLRYSADDLATALGAA